MPLNAYIWNLYKQNEQGKETIRLFTEGNYQDLLSTFVPDLSPDLQFVEDLIRFCPVPVEVGNLSTLAAVDFFEQIFINGLTLTYKDGKSEQYTPQSIDFLDFIPELSTWLYFVYPDTFKPYYYTTQFYLLTRIADTFGMSLPVVPLKQYKQKRLQYYVQLCEVFLDFQRENQLSHAEFCAFLYDFAPNYLGEPAMLDQRLPQPTQVWWIGGNKGGGDFEFVDQLSQDEISFWQGNVDTKRGDILVMYCLAPRSYIHSIWRATTDGIADPFFHYYSSIYIGLGQKVPPITIHELKADAHFSQNALVRKNLQGINGYSLDARDYERLLTLIKDKGGDLTALPRLYSHSVSLNKALTKEEHVERQLIEPLLEQLGYRLSDWERQWSLRMGRGERNYPDYAFVSDRTEGYEKASMLIECKLSIRNNRDLEDAFKQVWSYGQRLGASTLVIADKDSIWVYQKKQDGFDRASYTRLLWQELEQPDNFNRLKKLIGKR